MPFDRARTTLGLAADQTAPRSHGLAREVRRRAALGSCPRDPERGDCRPPLRPAELGPALQERPRPLRSQVSTREKRDRPRLPAALAHRRCSRCSYRYDGDSDPSQRTSLLDNGRSPRIQGARHRSSPLAPMRRPAGGRGRCTSLPASRTSGDPWQSLRGYRDQAATCPFAPSRRARSICRSVGPSRPRSRYPPGQQDKSLR